MQSIAHEIIEPLSFLWWQVNSITVLSIIILLFFSKKINSENLKKFTFFVGVVLSSRVILIQLYQFYLGIWLVSSSLPIQLCGLSSILAGILMFKRTQFAYECLFYWGLGGAMQSLLTPEFTLGKDNLIIFIDYFISHGGIIFSALYLTLILKMRPREKSWFSVFLFSQILIPIIGLVNWLLDSNYMYLCQKPISDNPLVIGEWPYYIIFIELIALINFWLLYQPIKLLKK